MAASIFFSWCQEFENEPNNAHVHDPHYWRACIRYMNEFLTQFSAEEALSGCLCRVRR